MLTKMNIKVFQVKGCENFYTANQPLFHMNLHLTGTVHFDWFWFSCPYKLNGERNWLHKAHSMATPASQCSKSKLTCTGLPRSQRNSRQKSLPLEIKICA